jgi:hypothetical protein
MKSKRRELHLNLKREYFAKIAAKTKRTEYRERKPYWTTRLEGREYDVIVFRNGYSKQAPTMVVEYLGLRPNRGGRKADYVIRLGRILEIKRWRA